MMRLIYMYMAKHRINCCCCFHFNLIEPCHEKICIMPYANNKGADQPAQMRSLISAFVVRRLDSIIPVLAKSKISRL